jgi:hypothetical protein
MKDKYYAHSQEGKPTEDWHLLEDHLKAVAEMARKNWPINSTMEALLIFES